MEFLLGEVESSPANLVISRFYEEFNSLDFDRATVKDCRELRE